ncbi:phytanoyl-CoA dioxygenase [Cladorrhinum sp. PSN332]|nr:phytanoyl-CoA dioxygenase [Cladorrhinum sp. PSN332]
MASSALKPDDPLLSELETNGFIVIPFLLSERDLAPVVSATRDLVSLAREGGWPHVRTVGKQFPPWDASLAAKNGIWGVQHLLHPDLPVAGARDLYTKLYFHREILNVASRILGCPGEDKLVMELFNLLVDPPADFALSWHRDDVPADFTAEQELEALLSKTGRGRHAQYNLALVDGDESLAVVPGSHKRARTEEERRVQDAWEKNGGEGEDAKMPGELVVKLDRGDAVFYDNNILHRGVYKAGRERMTVHGSVGHVEGAKGRARNVLQHGVGEWVGECDFGCLGKRPNLVRERAEAMRARLVEMGSGEGVGYSLEG